MSNGKHSIKVSTLFKTTAKILKKSFEEGESLAGQIYSERHTKKPQLLGLLTKVSNHKSELDVLIEKSQILVQETRLCKYLCMVLMTELLFSKGILRGESKPELCVLGYKSKFEEILKELKDSGGIENDNTSSIKDVKHPRYVRVNTNLMSRAEAIEAFLNDGWKEVTNGNIDDPDGNVKFDSYDRFLEAVKNLGDYDFLADFHVRNLFVFPASSRNYWARHYLVLESKVLLQNKASCLPAFLLDAPRGSVILDMCAAPGMKTSHLAAIIKNKGTIYAVEQHNHRFEVLKEMVRSTKSTSVKLLHQDALALTDTDVPSVEYILVDPTCSGSGMSKRLFSAKEDVDQRRLEGLGRLQIKLLSHALRAFPKAKKVIYSTCSIYSEENEYVVQECLNKWGIGTNWELIKPLEFAEKWKNFGHKKYKHIGKNCFYAKQDTDLSDGFFVAIFQRKDNEVNNGNVNSKTVKQGNATFSMNNFLKGSNVKMTHNEQQKAKDEVDHVEGDDFASDLQTEVEMENQKKDNTNLVDANNKENQVNLNENDVMEVDQQEKKKKKKKKNKEKNEGIKETENVQVDHQDTDNIADIQSKKEKKRKRKKSESIKMENEETTIANVEEYGTKDIIDESSEISKGKKKKSKKMELNDEEGNADVFGGDEQPKKKKKKKIELNEKVGNADAFIGEDQRKKKKKKKHEKSEK